MPTPLVENYDAIVLGAGAAGLMCAIEAGKRGRRVAVLEHAERIGKKILISGGGRCNFTNLHCRPDNFFSANPHFCKSALARYTPRDFVFLVEKHGIPYHEKAPGQLFCDRSARDIVAMLEEECRRAGVRLAVATRIGGVRQDGSGFSVKTVATEFRAPRLVVATGGLSIPKMGATAFGYELASQFGIGILERHPALVPLVFKTEDRRNYCDLAGVSLEVVAAAGGRQFRDRMLITHRGLSGPAILQISSCWREGLPIAIDLVPGQAVTALMRRQGSRRDLLAAKALLRTFMPSRFAERWLDLLAPSQWTNHALDRLERRMHQWEIVPEGTEGYAKAEVTAGGVDTGELSAHTMEARKVPGLFFIGEVVDVTGELGGFNFQWAWASGFCAGQSL